MTNEEIDQFVERLRLSVRNAFTTHISVFSAKQALDIIDQLRKENHWIPVSERLPGKGRFCHLYIPEFNNNCPQKGWYLPDKKVWLTTVKSHLHTRKVTHWKPIILPEETK